MYLFNYLQESLCRERKCCLFVLRSTSGATCWRQLFVPKSLRRHEFNFVYAVLCSGTSNICVYSTVTCRLCYCCRITSGTVEDTSKALCLRLLFLASLFYTLCQFLVSPHISSGLHLVAAAIVNVSLNITRGIDVPNF